MKTAVSRRNLPDLPALHRLVRRAGAHEWHLFPVEPIGRGADHRDDILEPAHRALLFAFYERAKRVRHPSVCYGEQPPGLCRWPTAEIEAVLRCDAGVSSLAVLADGRVVPCVQSRGPVQGNVRERRLRDIWRGGFQEQRCPGWRRCPAHVLPGR